MAVPNVYDALLRYCLSKVGDSSIKPSTFVQVLLNAGGLNGTNGVRNGLTLGNPDTITVFLRTDTAATVKFSLSQDASDWYHDTQFDIVFSGSGEKVVKVTGAQFIKVTASTDLTTASVRIQANYS